MVIDTSAIVALVRSEPGHERISDALADADSCVMSAATRVELGIVLDQRVLAAENRRATRILDQARVVIAPVDEALALRAIDAHRAFGRGSGHPARLNFGDCFSYALAIALDEPLLFVGDDFSCTDVTPALARD